MQGGPDARGDLHARPAFFGRGGHQCGEPEFPTAVGAPV